MKKISIMKMMAGLKPIRTFGLIGVFGVGLGGVWMVPIHQGSAEATVLGDKAGLLVSQLALQLTDCMRLSRPVLLGSRNPSGPSCIQVVNPGEVTKASPQCVGDLDGGPGTRLGLLYLGERATCKSAKADFQWHQGRLKTFLENMLARNEVPLREADSVHEKAMALLEMAKGWQRWPANLHPIPFQERNDWPSYCLSSLNNAVAARNLQAVRYWTAELASATFELEELHRWVEFLVKNQLAALEFQAECGPLFEWADPLIPKYDPLSHICAFPAGMLCLRGLDNYYEVEHQAESLFCMPQERFDELTFNRHLTAASVWVYPGLRECFLKLEGQLSGSNRQAWAEAARTPYLHGMLVNLLYRAWRGRTVEELAVVLRRFDAAHPHASAEELMGVVMSRGHSFGGMEWADRYQPALMAASDRFSGSDQSVFQAAHDYVYRFYHNQASYGLALTLRESLQHKELDCVRATDMIGALYRNAGRAGFGYVQWSGGTVAHSVAAALVSDAGQSKVLLADGMAPVTKSEEWPMAAFAGAGWPAGLEKNPPPYAMELYLSGLDNYVWAEGCIARDASAGSWFRTALPYFSGRAKEFRQQIAVSLPTH